MKPYLPFLLCFLFFEVSAQSGEFVHFSDAGSINDIVELDDYFWIATDGGLVKYEKSTGLFDVQVPTNSGIPDSRIGMIEITPNNHKWITTNHDRALIEHDGNNWINHNDSIFEIGVGLVRILDLQSTSDGVIYAHVQNNQNLPQTYNLLKYQDETWEEIIVPTGENVESFTITPTDEVYMLVENGLFRYNGQTWQGVGIGINLSNFRTENVFSDGMNNVWVVFKTNPGSSSFSNFVRRYDGTSWEDVTANFTLPDNHGAYIQAYPQIDGSIWFHLYDDSQLLKFHNDQYEVFTYTDLDLPVDTRGFEVYHQDESGTWWLGSNSIDTSFHYLENSTWVPVNISRSNNFQNGEYSEIVFDSLYQVWTISKQGLHKFDGTEWSVFTPQNSGMPESWGSNNKIAIHPDGSIWGSSNEEGLFRYDGQSWSNPADGMPNAPTLAVTNLAISEEGTVYCSEYDNNGLFVFEDNEWTHYSESNSPIGSGIIDLAIGIDQTIWMISSEPGGYEIIGLKPNGSWKIYNQSNTILPTYFWGLHVDNFGQLIAFSYDEMYLFNGDWHSLEIASGAIAIEGIRTIYQGYNNDYWISAIPGLIRFNDAEYEIFDFHANSSLTSGYFSEINQDYAGNFWLGGDRGIHIFNKDSISIQPLPNKYDVSGQIFYDQNEDGIADPGETGMAGQQITIEPDGIQLYSQLSGHFQYPSLPGTFTYEAITPTDWSVTSPLNPATVEVLSDDVSDIDFGFFPNNAFGAVQTAFTSGFVACDHVVPYWYSFTNTGSISIDPQLTIIIPSEYEYESGFPQPDIQIGDSLIWYPQTLQPFENELFKFRLIAPDVYSIDETFVLNSFFEFDGEIVHDSLIQVMQCAYDPNDKQAQTATSYLGDTIQVGDDLTYTIRFQNLGSWYASRVVIRDNMDTKLDLNTFELIASSHPVNTLIHQDGLLEFKFEQINLPPAEIDEPGSQGFVTFKLAQMPDLLPETIINNQAAIYFDLNPPIWTNITESLIWEAPIVIGLSPNSAEQFDFQVYPNPGNDILQVRISSIHLEQSFQVLDSFGHHLFGDQIDSNKFELDIKLLPSGIYFLKIESDRLVISKKFVVIK